MNLKVYHLTSKEGRWQFIWSNRVSQLRFIDLRIWKDASSDAQAVARSIKKAKKTGFEFVGSQTADYLHWMLSAAKRNKRKKEPSCESQTRKTFIPPCLQDGKQDHRI